MAKGEPVDGSPQIDDVALAATLWIEALEEILVEVDAEGATLAARGVDRTGPLALVATATQAGEEAQVLENPLKGQLGFEVSEINPGDCGRGTGV